MSFPLVLTSFAACYISARAALWLMRTWSTAWRSRFILAHAGSLMFVGHVVAQLFRVTPLDAVAPLAGVQAMLLLIDLARHQPRTWLKTEPGTADDVCRTLGTYQGERP